MPEESQNLREFEPNNLSPRPPLDKNQKIALVVLSVFAVLVVVLWLGQLRSTINRPFADQGTSQLATGEQAENEQALKNKDTDGDGLTDWNELYLYKTSPYLEDSDSDGFSDKQEIDAGKDPNCPVGRDCGNLGIVEGDQGVVKQGETQPDNSSLNSLMDQLGASPPSQTDTTSLSGPDLQTILGANLDAATLRQLLLGAGMQKEMLDKISDEELLKSYQEMLAKPSP